MYWGLVAGLLLQWAGGAAGVGPSEEHLWNFDKEHVFNTPYEGQIRLFPRPTPQALKSIINEGQELLLLFTADWCANCRLFESELHAAVTALDEELLKGKAGQDGTGGTAEGGTRRNATSQVYALDAHEHPEEFVFWGVDALPHLVYIPAPEVATPSTSEHPSSEGVRPPGEGGGKVHEPEAIEYSGSLDRSELFLFLLQLQGSHLLTESIGDGPTQSQYGVPSDPVKVRNNDVFDRIATMSRHLGLLCGCDTRKLLREEGFVAFPFPVVEASDQICGKVLTGSTEGDSDPSTSPTGCSFIHKLFQSPWESRKLPNRYAVDPNDKNSGQATPNQIEAGSVNFEDIVLRSRVLRVTQQTLPLLLKTKLPVLITFVPHTASEATINKVRRSLRTVQKNLETNNTPFAVFLSGSEKPVEQKLVNYLGLSTWFDSDEETALSFTLPFTTFILEKEPLFFPEFHVGALPTRSKYQALEDGTALPPIVYQFLPAEWQTSKSGEKEGKGETAMQKKEDSQSWACVPPQAQSLDYYGVASEAKLSEDLTDFVSSVLPAKLTGAEKIQTLPCVLKNEPLRSSFALRRRGVVDINADAAVRLLADPTANLVLLVYTKWCSSCHTVNKIFQQTSERFAATSIAFARLNADVNEIPFMSVQLSQGSVQADPALDAALGVSRAHYRRLPVLSYPAIWLASSTDPTPVEFVGDDSVEALTDFVAASFGDIGLVRQEL